MTVAAGNERLVELADLDELVRQIDRLCDAGEWKGLVDLRDRSRAALDRGKQLWPVASLAEYRLALDGPGPDAARVIVPGAGHLSFGPLPEVVAVHHRWADLAADIPDGPLATITAHERVVRGEDLSGEARLDERVLELPAMLQPWEPTYPLADYEPDTARFPPPSLPSRWETLLPSPGPDFVDRCSTDALLDLAGAWTAESDGRAECRAVRGDARQAIAALGPTRVRMADLAPDAALAWMAWVGASGGAYGRRRGMAAGRFAAWWTLAALAGLSDQWPIPPDELGDVANELRWFAWDAWEPDTGWRFHLAVEDCAEDLAWAIAATDAA